MSAPHPRQNLVSSAFCDPHFGQYISALNTLVRFFPRQCCSQRFFGYALVIPGNHSYSARVMLVMRLRSPRFVARLAGIFFLLTLLGGIIAQGFISDSLINFGDAAATANNSLANRGMFQAGFTIFLLEMACQLITTALIYLLLRPV